MSDQSNNLNTKLKDAAKKKVGSKALKSKYGIDCFGLVDALLRSVGANSAHDYNDEVPVTAKADYMWGNGIMLASIQAGDILQFRKHVVEITTHTRLADGKWFETEQRHLSRPHHSAIVLKVQEDGGVVVVEQNIQPKPGKVRSSIIPKLDAGQAKRYEDKGDTRITIKVTGDVWAYRPVPKTKKGASLLGPADRSSAGQRGVMAKASVVRAKGGANRQPGPAGMDETYS